MKVVAGRIVGAAADKRRTLWETPADVFAYLDAFFHFGLDAAALPNNAKVANYITPEEDALKCWWGLRAPGEAIFINPPFGHRLGKFVDKMVDEAERGATIVAILPASIETRYWKKIFATAKVWVAVEKRMVFTYHGQPDSSAMGPTAIVVWTKENNCLATSYMVEHLRVLGAVMTMWCQQKGELCQKAA